MSLNFTLCFQDAHTFVSIIHYGDTFSTSTMNKFEDRIAEMAENMSAVELATVRELFLFET